MNVAQKAILKYRQAFWTGYKRNESDDISDVFTALDNWCEYKVDVNLRGFWIFPDNSVVEFVPKTQLLKRVKSLDVVALLLGRERLKEHP